MFVYLNLKISTIKIKKDTILNVLNGNYLFEIKLFGKKINHNFGLFQMVFVKIYLKLKFFFLRRFCAILAQYHLKFVAKFFF